MILTKVYFDSSRSGFLFWEAKLWDRCVCYFFLSVGKGPESIFPIKVIVSIFIGVISSFLFGESKLCGIEVYWWCYFFRPQEKVH